MPPHVWFIVGAVFHYIGPAWAVLLFGSVDVLAVAWLRIGSAALVFMAWRRPWRAAVRRRLRRRDWVTIALFGTVLAMMNATFYLAIDVLPLGTVAAIEFVPVIVLAAIGAGTRRNLLAVALAATGAYLLVNVEVGGSPRGVAFAVANAVLFACYIIIAHRLAGHGRANSIDSLAIAMTVAWIVSTPFGAVDAVPALGDASILAAAVGVGVCSSVIPYVADQFAMKRLTRSAYALFVAILPATAAVVGLVVLHQVPGVVEVAAVALVVAGVALRTETGRGTER